MTRTRTHWTEKSTDDFLFRIGADFVAQLESKMEALPMKQSELAEELGVTKGRISQIFNEPGNLTLNLIIKCARAVGMKASVVAYDDGDKKNERGPIHSEIFRMCWERQGSPADIWSFKERSAQTVVIINTAPCVYERSGMLLPHGIANSASLLWYDVSQHLLGVADNSCSPLPLGIHMTGSGAQVANI